VCGIVGIFDSVGKRDIDRALLGRMNESQFHRGPDEGGLHTEPGLGLGHRRLSIIDLSGGRQPMHSADGNVVLTYNGEVYNFRELRTELESLGHAFRTASDTEVILAAWQAWGDACVERLRGMFAFVIWDRGRETLFLARDRLGIKPLYYAALPEGQFLFASELKALRCHPQCPGAVDPTAVEDYFAFGYIPEPKTIYRNVFKLEPGHTLTLRRGGTDCTPRQYWDVRFDARASGSEQDIACELIERLREAVAAHMVADVPLGAFLSGGVDSSAVVAMMAGVSDQPVNTCSISFGDPTFNEAGYAHLVAERYRTAHRVEQVEPDTFDLLDRLAGLYDEPYADSSALPTYRLCELARRHVTVALSGDGGDENLAGYTRYRWHTQEDRLRRLLPDALRRPLVGLLARVYPDAGWMPARLRAKKTLQSIARGSLEGYFHSVAVNPDSIRRRLFSGELRRDLQGYRALEVFQRHWHQAPRGDALSMVQYLDLKTYLPGDILTKVDRASMAHALEVRVPLLDHKLVGWLATLPPSVKLREREGKYIFKKALEPYLPADILYRPKKGFSVPLRAWFMGPLKEKVEAALLGGVMADSGYFNQSFIAHMLKESRQGRGDYTGPIWSLLMFEVFLRRTEGMNRREQR
jgi:asparagine synthase (glutamine-hydrolysing)